jgi:hypothetical protein
MRWPWQREHAQPEVDERPAAPPREPRGWTTVEPLTPIAGPIEPVVDQRFERSLTSWQSPQTIEPVQHLVNIEATPTLVSGLSRPELPHPVPAVQRSRTEGTTYFPGGAPVQRTLSFAPPQPEAAPAPPVQRVLAVEPVVPLEPQAEAPAFVEPPRVEEPAPVERAEAPVAAPAPVVQLERATSTPPATLPERPTGTSDVPPTPEPTLVPEPVPPEPAPIAPRRRGLGAPLPRSTEPPVPPMPAVPPTAAVSPTVEVPPAEPVATTTWSPVETPEPVVEAMPVVETPAPATPAAPTVQLEPIEHELGGWSDAPAPIERLAVESVPLTVTRDAPRTRTWRAGEPLPPSAPAPALPAAAPPTRLAVQRSPIGAPAPRQAMSETTWSPIAPGHAAADDADPMTSAPTWSPVPHTEPEVAPRFAVQRTPIATPAPARPSAPTPREAASAAVSAGIAQREVDGSITFFDPDAASSPRPAPARAAAPLPVVSREASGPPMGPSSPAPAKAPGAAPGVGTTDLDELAQRLYGRMRSLLKRDLLLDRERSGSLVRGPR